MFNTILFIFGSAITVVCTILCLVLFFACKSKDKNGNRIVLTSKTTEKPWKLLTWIAGVFVAGTGVALMYAPSDLTGYIQQGLNPVESILMVTILNGMPVWALYSIMGLWYMKHMDSKVGRISAMLSTILGMSISLWTGTNTIVRFFGLNFPGLKFLIAAIIVIIAMISAKKNWLKNMSRIAFLVFVIAFLLVLATPKTEFTYTTINGGITKNFWKEYFMGDTAASWIFWFLSWAPTVARWLAHISKGRTMKEYIAGTMLLPTALALVWMIISWTHQDFIMNFNLASNFAVFIPCVVFITSGILFMVGTLDSDCRVFTEDLEELSKGKLRRKSVVPFYGAFVMFFFALFISGIIKKPFAFNEYSSILFVPIIVWSIATCVKILIKRKTTAAFRTQTKENQANEEE